MAGRRCARALGTGAAASLLTLAAACSPVLGPANSDSGWRAYDSVHFTLYVRPSSFAEANSARIGAALDAEYEHTLAVLDLRYSGRISGFLADGTDDALPGRRSGVAYTANEAFKAVCVAPLDDNLLAILAHESNHAIAGAALGPAGTSFVGEGLASAVRSERPPNYGPRALYSWTRTNRSQLPPLTDLTDDSKWARGSDGVAYTVAASFLAYLIEAYGAQPLKALYYADSGNFSARFQQIYGRPLQQAEQEWKDFCDRAGA